MSFDADSALAAFLRHLSEERRLAANTVSAYRRDLTQFLAAMRQSERAWPDIDTADIRHWAAQASRQGLSAKTVHRRLSAVRAFYRYWLQADRIAANPATAVSGPKTRQRLPGVLDVDQMSALLEHSGDDPLAQRDTALFELIYASGLRVSEAVGLRCQDIDMAQTLVRVQGKGGKTRIVPFGRKAKAALQVWLAVRRTVINAAQPPPAALFLSARGQALSVRSVQQRLRRRAAAIGVDARVHPHGLRHAAATHLLQSSGNLRAVQEFLGHANLATTQIYTHLDAGYLSQVYDAAHPRAKRGQD